MKKMKQVTIDQVINELTKEYHLEIDDREGWKYWIYLDEDGNFTEYAHASYWFCARVPYLNDLDDKLHEKYEDNGDTATTEFWNAVDTFESKDCSDFMDIVQQLTNDINEHLEREALEPMAMNWYEHISENPGNRKSFEDCLDFVVQVRRFFKNVRSEIEKQELPKLKGTEEEIERGEEIRHTYIEMKIKEISNHNNDPYYYDWAKKQVTGCKKLLMLAERANFWIDLHSNFSLRSSIAGKIADTMESKSDEELQREIYTYTD